MKPLLIFDLDGTLFDTREVNYSAYSFALSKFGYSLDHSYFCSFCNGRKYDEFLPLIIGTNDRALLEKIHLEKMKAYGSYLGQATCNQFLFSVIDALKPSYYIALVTTATRTNTDEILNFFGKESCFDFIVSQEDCQKPKPDPECFFKAIHHFGEKSDSVIIFEDSEIGVRAAKLATNFVYVVSGFNA